MKTKLLYVCILVTFAAGGYFFYSYTNSTLPKYNNGEMADEQKMAEAIKKVEAEAPPRIGESPTEEEINGSPFIKHVRVALNGYLDGSNTGVESASLGDTDEMKCGLNNFDKTYYRSKFIILDASDNDYGGVQAEIVFVDKPDTIFWVWVYRLGWDGEYVLRGFCYTGPPEEKKIEFKSYISGLTKDAKYRY